MPDRYQPKNEARNRTPRPAAAPEPTAAPKPHKRKLRAKAALRPTWRRLWLDGTISASLVDDSVVTGRLCEVTEWGVVIEQPSEEGEPCQVMIPRDSIFRLDLLKLAPPPPEENKMSPGIVGRSSPVNETIPMDAETQARFDAVVADHPETDPAHQGGTGGPLSVDPLSSTDSGLTERDPAT